MIKGPSGMRQARVYRVKIAQLVPEGTVVKKGDFVAKLDQSDLSSALQDAELELKQRQTSLKEAKLDTASTLTGARDKVISQEFSVEQAKIAVEQSKYESPATQQQVKNDLKKAKRQYEQAKMSLKLAEQKAKSKIEHDRLQVQDEQDKIKNMKKLSKEFTIHAPQNGMVIYERSRDGSKIGEGDQISAFNPVVAKLPDFSVMQSITYVSEVDIQKVKKGQNVNIGLDAFPDLHLTGTVTHIANIGEQRPNSSSKVFKVTIQVNQSDSLLRPAMTTSNVIHTNFVDSALYVPLETIHTYHDSINIVYKHRSGKPIMQQVILGLMNNTQAIVKAGLSPDDQLYLSMPSDTSRIKKVFLPDSIIRKYKKQKPPKKEIRERKAPKEGRFGRGHGDFRHKPPQEHSAKED
jgi:multidrug resistance efflux pump